jgi:hypothetical protein
MVKSFGFGKKALISTIRNPQLFWVLSELELRQFDKTEGINV